MLVVNLLKQVLLVGGNHAYKAPVYGKAPGTAIKLEHAAAQPASKSDKKPLMTSLQAATSAEVNDLKPILGIYSL